MQAVADLQTCAQLVQSLSLFSANEDQEDIATAGMDFRTEPYNIGGARLRALRLGPVRRPEVPADPLPAS